MTLRVALVGGPMYDHLYRLLDVPGTPEVEIVVHADHPTLNAEVAARLGAGERLDVIATHSKYAPSQAAWLRPLDGLVDTGELAPLAVDLCRFDDRQYCVPRLIDVRILWAHADRVTTAPDTWAALADGSVVMGFPGRESGLFGTFFELVVGAGGRLFDDDGRPCIDSPEAVAAVDTLCAVAAKAPADLPDWHYDQVDRALLDGRVDAAGAWPGAWGAIREIAALEPHPYPAGPRRRVSYAGCHAWAIPTTCADVPGALELVRRLTSYEAGALDAAGGSVCAHVAAFSDVEPTDDRDRRRLAITADTIATAMITYPPHVRFPEVEDAGWRSIRAALCGELSAAQAVHEVQRVALEVLAADA
ncbi:MAG: extracellular solute-binding protein [Acidimicrobiales bacterium]